MNALTEGLTNCVAYLYDIIVYTDSWQELFKKLETAGLVVNLAKSVIAKAQVIYLGHVVGLGQVMPRSKLYWKCLPLSREGSL